MASSLFGILRIFDSCCAFDDCKQDGYEFEIEEQHFKDRLQNSVNVMVMLEDGSKLACTLKVNCDQSLIRIACEDQVREMKFDAIRKILHTKAELSRVQTQGTSLSFDNSVALHLAENGNCLRNKNARIKNPYYRKKGFWEWRKKHIQKLNKARYKRQFLVPKVIDPEEEPVKGKHDANIWEFVVDGLPIGLKRLKLYTKLLTNLHLQDAIDWLYAMPTIRTNRILNSLSDAQKKIYEEYNGDPSRLYIDSMVINYKTPMKQIKYHALSK
eukprot:XP_001609252.1 hypothetical protein [Babesia bovis T2Bo]